MLFNGSLILSSHNLNIIVDYAKEARQYKWCLGIYTFYKRMIKTNFSSILI
jgi:hypothetical protein